MDDIRQMTQALQHGLKQSLREIGNEMDSIKRDLRNTANEVQTPHFVSFFTCV